MIKRSRVGLIIWGSIFMVIGLVQCIWNYLLFDTIKCIGMYVGLAFFVGGLAMLIPGIISATKVADNNKKVAANPNVYMTRCFHCGHDIQCHERNFQPHGRYPEGFLYCPICRKPLSKNAFNVYMNQDGKLVPLSKGQLPVMGR